MTKRPVRFPRDPEGRRIHDLNQENPLSGRRIEHLPRMFILTARDRMRAAAGLPSWMARRKRIERAMEHLHRDLRQCWEETAPEAWEERARSWDLGEINRQIQDYNRYYPIERDLPMDPRTRDYREGASRWERLAPITPRWILEHYPPQGAGTARP